MYNLTATFSCAICKGKFIRNITETFEPTPNALMIVNVCDNCAMKGLEDEKAK